MIVFIKDKNSFITKTMVSAVDYEVHESIYDTVSTITIPTQKSPINEGDFLMFDGMPFVGIVTEVDIDGGRTEISVEQAIKLFSRDMFYSATSYTYMEDYLKDLIDDNYTNCTDDLYEVPFLSVNALSHTSGSCKPDLDDNIFNIKSYTSKLRRLQDIVCEWDFNRTQLVLNIYKKSFGIHNIDMSNPRYIITEQTISNQVVGKITVFCEENSSYSNWYLKTDGTVTSTQPSDADRVQGDWTTLVVNNVADITDDVKDEFAKNYYSHKISFLTNSHFEIYDRLKLRMDGKIFNSYVSGIIHTKGSKYIEVECGELQTQYPFLNRL